MAPHHGNRIHSQGCPHVMVDKMAQGKNFNLLLRFVGRDSSVGIAIRYGLDGPAIESRWGQGFPRPSRKALGPAKPPVHWVPGLYRG